MDDVLDRRVQELLADAQAEAEKRSWARARALANAVLVLDPDNTQARRLVDGTEREPEGEWRQLTVMFCDMVGSTSLSERLSGEAYRDVLLRYQAVCDDVIARHGGRIAKFQGDGILAYFGHPVVHEDDAHRGVRAGLELPTAFEPVATALKAEYGEDIAVRVAVHTGMVVVSDMGTARSPEPAAIVGEAPNLAARLQDHARPNSMVISGSTYELVRGYFVVERRGSVELRGLTRPVEVFEVVGEGLADTRIDAARELSPFVGRSIELEQLEGLWRDAAEGQAAIALVLGDAGIGKTRLVDVMRRRVADRGAATLAAWCSPQRTASNLWAARRLVEFACAVSSRSNPEDALRRVERALAVDGEEASLPLFAALLGLPGPAVELAPAAMREATLEALVRWITKAAAREPRLIVVDDLHWSDPSTVELLHRVVRSRPPGLFLAMTSRPGVALPWLDTAVTTIQLGPLSRADLVRMAAAKNVEPPRLEDVIDRSDGVPFYFEELLVAAGKAAPANRPVPLSWKHDVPPSLIGPLLARIEAPGVDMGVVQTMAVIGHEVPCELLAAVMGVEPGALSSQLEALVAGGLVEQLPTSDADDGAPPTYRFHHRLLWELVYDMQLLPARVSRHGRVADALIERAGSLEAADGAVLGPHLEQAVRTAEAVRAYTTAARAAVEQGAEAEAAQMIARGFELLESLPEGETLLALELPLRQLRGLSATTREGYLSVEAMADHERCLEICQTLPSRPEYLPAVLGVWIFYWLKGELDRADSVLDAQAERMAEAWPGIDVEPGCRQIISFFRGDLPRMVSEANAYLASPHDLMDDRAGPTIVRDWPNPTDPVSIALTFLGLARYFQGRWDETQAHFDRALARSGDWPFPYGAFTWANTHAMRTVVHRQADDRAGGRAAAEEVKRVGERHGFAFWTLTGNLAVAFLDAQEGAEGGLDRAETLLNVWRFTGADAWTPAYLYDVARAYVAHGDHAAALRCLEESEMIGTRTGSLIFASETARLLGEVRLATGDRSGVANLAAAVKIAEEQGARLFELRARTLLHRHDPSLEDGVMLAAVLAEVEQGGDLDSPLAPRADIEAARAALST